MGVICSFGRDGVSPSLIFGSATCRPLPVRFQRPQILQQFLGMTERNFVRLLQPSEFSQILHAGGFERQYNFSQIEPLDFRQFLRRAVPVFLARPKPQANAGRRAARPARALVGADDWLIFSMSSVLMPRYGS